MKGFVKVLVLSLAAAVIASCAQKRPVLEKGSWEPRVYEALCELIESYGSGSGSYDLECRPYAVFDFDNTTIINDIAYSLLCWQIENLEFRIKPEDMFAVLTTGIPDLDADYGGGNTPRSLASEISADYSELLQYEDRQKMRQSDAYLDFRAKLWYFSTHTDISAPDTPFECEWITTLLSGMNDEEITTLTRQAADEMMQADGMWAEEWTSPDGKASWTVKKGLGITPEMKNLYSALQQAGFDVYICSASLESIVEAIACEPRYGFGLDPEAVWGFRMTKDSEGGLITAPEQGYVQPYREGKVSCIRERIAPAHRGHGPALVAGDSNGDLSMLTSFPDLKVGLIIDCLRTGGIAELAEEARRDSSDINLKQRPRPLYVVQGRRPSSLSFIPCSKSEPAALRED